MHALINNLAIAVNVTLLKKLIRYPIDKGTNYGMNIPARKVYLTTAKIYEETIKIIFRRVATRFS